MSILPKHYLLCSLVLAILQTSAMAEEAKPSPAAVVEKAAVETEIPKVAPACIKAEALKPHQLAANLESNIKTLLDTKNCPECYLQGADLRGANLEDADLLDANLSKANLSGANLQKALLSNANLSEANLEKAQLQDSLIKDANLHKANIKDANMGELSPAEIKELLAEPVAPPKSKCRGIRG
jgi:hypothetical protein